MNSIAPLRLAEGIHPGIPEAAYHADCAIEPSASSGILRTIYGFSADHARAAHPRLNPQYRETPSTDAMNRGTILHALTLGTPAAHRVLDVPDYKKDAARALRDETIAAGLIPVKIADMAELQDVAASIRARLLAMPEVWAAMQNAIAERMNEVTLIWRERGVLCRCRYDTLPAARFKATYDPKFTSVPAEPSAFGKKVLADYAFQAELYPRAVKALRGDRPLFVFVACETDPPYGVSLHALDPAAAALAKEKVDQALAMWAEALRADAWPSYPPLIHFHGPKPWQVTDADERQVRREKADKLTPEQAARWNEAQRKMMEVGR